VEAEATEAARAAATAAEEKFAAARGDGLPFPAEAAPEAEAAPAAKAAAATAAALRTTRTR
jgi:hypothetical protein